MYTKSNSNWNGAMNCSTESGKKTKNEWNHGWQNRSSWSGKDVRNFTVRGWPAVALVIIAIAVLSGPILGLTFFLVRLAFGLLPLLIIGGLIAFGVRYAMRKGMGHHSSRWEDMDKWKEYGAARWDKWKRMTREWDSNADDEKTKNDEKRKNDKTDVVYM